MGEIFNPVGAFSVSKVSAAVAGLVTSQLGLLFLAFGVAPLGLVLVYRLIRNVMEDRSPMSREEWALYHNTVNEYKARGGQYALSAYEKALVGRGNRRRSLLQQRYSSAARTISSMGMPSPSSSRRRSGGYRPRYNNRRRYY